MSMVIGLARRVRGMDYLADLSVSGSGSAVSWCSCVLSISRREEPNSRINEEVSKVSLLGAPSAASRYL